MTKNTEEMETNHTFETNFLDKKLFIETYGCQMNVADSEVVASIMQMAGFEVTDNIDEADAIFVNTCSIRDNAEQKVLSRLQYFNSLKKKKKKNLLIGVIGCMAERVKEDLIQNHGVHLVAGPDSYLDLPNLVSTVERGEKAINVELSTTETYRTVMPSRIGGKSISGFISIMRGCNNFCSYCIVPYTRGRERSRDVASILGELKDLQSKGFKEVTLLGQNVNSYKIPSPLNLPQGDFAEVQSPKYNTANPVSYEVLKESVKNRRKNPTEAESFLWQNLQNKQLEGYKFRREHIIGDCIVDFVCLSKQLVIEVDGGYHNEENQKEFDQARTEYLNQKGFKVIRFTNEEVLNEIEKTLKTIKFALTQVSLEGDLEGFDFADLLKIVAESAPEMRIRFTTSHPKDMCDRTLEVIAAHHNLCKSIHLPVQSGSNKILQLMNRKYTREWYLERIAAIKRIIPESSITTDMFCGFHSETEEDHQETLSLMREVGFDMAFMFKYSERPGTYASKHLPDDVSEEIKVRRLQEIIDLQNKLSEESNKRDIGKTFEVLVEGVSKRSKEQFFGRTSQNKVVVFPREDNRIGDYVHVKINEASSATLIGEIVK